MMHPLQPKTLSGTRLSRCHMLLWLSSLFTAASYATPQSTKDTATTSVTVGTIKVINHPIFDEDDPDAFFLHRWANFLHINTQESTILDKLSFAPGDQVNQHTLAEAQRILRAQPYLRDSQIQILPDAAGNTAHQDATIEVKTWDNWSLLPTLSIGRSGGNNRFSFGIKEDNLLGKGIRTRLKYQSNADRTGYKLAFDTPLKWVHHARLQAEIQDNDDGQAHQLAFDKPFYTLDGKRKYRIEYADNNRIDTLRQNGEETDSFRHRSQFINASYGWLHHTETDSIQRLITGITQDQHLFSRDNQLLNSTLPQDRRFLYPWLAWEYIEDDFKVLNNVHLINYNEDFNLGWQHYVQLGVETRDIHHSPGYHLQWYSSRGYHDDNLILLLSLAGKSVLNTQQKNFYRLDLSSELFYQLTPKWTLYQRLQLASSKNNYLDQPFSLGDSTGIRGYPDGYQQGDQQWQLTGEVRNYPNINLYQLAELGWAVFADIGRAFGDNADTNVIKGAIGSIGIGARIYSSRSSYGNVAHIDLSVPLNKGPGLDNWEWRFEVRNRF